MRLPRYSIRWRNDRALALHNRWNESFLVRKVWWRFVRITRPEHSESDVDKTSDKFTRQIDSDFAAKTSKWRQETIWRETLQILKSALSTLGRHSHVQLVHVVHLQWIDHVLPPVVSQLARSRSRSREKLSKFTGSFSLGFLKDAVLERFE